MTTLLVVLRQLIASAVRVYNWTISIGQINFGIKKFFSQFGRAPFNVHRKLAMLPNIFINLVLIGVKIISLGAGLYEYHNSK